MRNLLFLLIFMPSVSQACSCYFTEYFCEYAAGFFEWSPEETTIVRAQFQELRIVEGGRVPLFDITVKEIIAGNAIVGQTYSLLGQDGANCNGPIIRMTEGKDYILLFVNSDRYFSAYGLNNIQNPFPIRDFPGCGPAALTINGLNVSGTISEGTDRLSFNRFRSELAECIGPDVINEDQVYTGPKFIPSTVFPNPAKESFTVSFENNAIYAVDLYDLSGRVVSRENLGGTKVSQHVVNVDALSPGVYFLVMETDGLRIKKRVVVQ